MNEPQLQDVHILVVEDHDDSREMLAEVLSLEGARVEQAHDAMGALAHLRAQTFDAVVTDIAMPGATGFWLLDQIRKTDSWRRLPVIAVSGNASKESAESAGFAAYFRKPADPFALCQTLASLVRATR